MAQIISFPNQDTAVAFIERTAGTQTDDRPAIGSTIIECDPQSGVSLDQSYIFRAYDMTVSQALRLLQVYHEITAA